LWPEMLRAIREIQPRWVVGENVFGLINWSDGLVFHEVQTDLEAAGYEVWPYVLPAVSVNAPHRRDRVWFVAYRNTKQREWSQGGFQPEFTNGCAKDATNSNSFRLEQCENGTKMGRRQTKVGRERSESTNATKTDGKVQYASDTEIEQSKRMQSEQREHSKQEQGKFRRGNFGMGYEEPTGWETFPTQSPICTRNDGLSARLDGITFPKWRNESIKAAGNAIVPQVALQIFKAIEQYEQQNS